MKNSELEGALVALLPGGGRATKPFRALVVATDAHDLMVRVEEPPAASPAEVLVVIGREGGQLQARATVLPVGPAEWRLTLRSDWRTRLDNRLEPRYPLFEDAVVRVPGTLVSLPGRLVDLSTAGAALELSSWPGGRNLVVAAEWGGRQVAIPAQCVVAERTWQGVTVHCQFAGLDEATEAALESWVEDLRQTFEQVQKCLVYRVDDPWPSLVVRTSIQAA